MLGTHYISLQLGQNHLTQSLFYNKVLNISSRFFFIEYCTKSEKWNGRVGTEWLYVHWLCTLVITWLPGKIVKLNQLKSGPPEGR